MAPPGSDGSTIVTSGACALVSRSISSVLDASPTTSSEGSAASKRTRLVRTRARPSAITRRSRPAVRPEDVESIEAISSAPPALAGQMGKAGRDVAAPDPNTWTCDDGTGDGTGGKPAV